MNRILKILIEASPIIIMIALIPFVKNDYLLTGVYAIIITLLFIFRYEKKDYFFLIFGFIMMLVFESFFVSVGVETFNRNSLFGVMPIWLPILWAYAFVAIKRGIRILK